MLQLKELSIRLGHFALSGLDLQICPGEYFVLLGASGAGKTVLLETLAGLHRPSSGSILLDGVDITSEAIQRRPMALVYQDQALFPHMSVQRNVAYGLEGQGMNRQDRQRRLRELEEQTGIVELAERRPATLSGGEAQRVALARALARRPRYLLLDEPLASLDCGARGGLRALLRRLHRQGQTILHVTHDFEEALALATRVAVIEEGRVVQIGAPAEVFGQPRSRFVAQFVGLRNVFRGRLENHHEAGVPLRRFHAGNHVFWVQTDDPAGSGCLLVRGEDVRVAVEPPVGDLAEFHRGQVVDLVPVRSGVEVGVDIGLEIAALLDEETVQRLHLGPGREVWVSISSGAARYLGDTA